MKYFEVGIGNTWLVRTEIELADGTEIEKKGIEGPIRFQSCYIRFWIGKRILILDSCEGIKTSIKNRNKFKMIVGIASL
ncbi:DUF3977 domain-containing protein [Lysinibacillus sp. 2017]|uniref:DUF3977 family protein n=1 Tax=unclassified Lysinibacillus TaxID=2636778 RepID=UPI000D527488|nr:MULTISPECIES: DUF3977 family protein [unclassified Lysinibacillus]AWE07154.1 DUF3977 domain-containing protein [Lysinibacillus sp. 2017]TGN36926.1 DUF3977 family protein [Lysinibacillus sp. S2017]